MMVSIKIINPEKATYLTSIVGIYQGGELTPSAKKLDKMSNGSISKFIAHHQFDGQFSETLPLLDSTRDSANEKLKSMIIIGCGKKEKLTPILFKRLITASAQALNAYKISEAVCYLNDLSIAHYSESWKVKQMAEAFYDALYRFELFKSEKKPLSNIKDFIIPISKNASMASCQKALKQAKAIVEGMTLTKNLANTPSNICTPHFLAEQAKALAQKYPAIKVKVLGESKMRTLGMGAILGVSQGSAEEAQLILLEYHDKGKKRAPIGLIGKGITFDTGGNSLKTPEHMIGMKYDMSGAAAVLGTFKAAAVLGLPISLIGIIPAVENMPGGTAYKPEDILTSLSGQTIEVISTDAEGRLVLADALTYCERYQPEVVIDIATLTGAVVIALGFHATGLLSNNEGLAKSLLKAGEESNDRAWQLPLWDDYQDLIRSPFADMANTGGRPAGTITAACFLSRFAKKFRWAHLDVAGTAAMMMGTGERYATGRPVPLLMQYLINQANENVE